MTFYSFNGDASDAQANAGYTLDFFHVATKTKVKFKAFITNISDQYQSNWEKEEVYGRMDPIQTFKSTQRVINVNWDIVAGSMREAKSNMAKLSDLFNMLYPVYQSNENNTNGMKASPLLRIKFANLISKSGQKGDVGQAGLLGSVDGFNFEPMMDDAMFGDSSGNLYPKVVSLSCTFSVIHEQPLGWSGNIKRTHSFPYGALGRTKPSPPISKEQPSDTEAPAKNVAEEQRLQSREDDIMSMPDGTTSGGNAI